MKAAPKRIPISDVGIIVVNSYGELAINEHGPPKAGSIIIDVSTQVGKLMFENLLSSISFDDKGNPFFRCSGGHCD